jgi:membrane protein DedA with SNARE-associated domain
LIGWAELVRGAEELAAGNVLLAGLTISFVGNAIPYMTVPYLAVIAGYAAAINDLWLRLLFTVVSGIGAGLGKVVVFLVGRGARFLVSPETRRNMELVARLARRSTFLAVFAFAALPLPDDVLYVPLGLMGYSLPLFTLAVVLGKILITGAAVLLGAGVSAVIVEADPTLAAVAAATAGIVISLIVARIRWVRVVEAYEAKGLWSALLVLGAEIISALTPRRARRG